MAVPTEEAGWELYRKKQICAAVVSVVLRLPSVLPSFNFLHCFPLSFPAFSPLMYIYIYYTFLVYPFLASKFCCCCLSFVCFVLTFCSSLFLSFCVHACFCSLFFVFVFCVRACFCSLFFVFVFCVRACFCSLFFVFVFCVRACVCVCAHCRLTGFDCVQHYRYYYL